MPRKRPSEEAQNDEIATRRGVGLPTLTHLQFLVLDLVRTDSLEVAAQEIMSCLRDAGVGHEGPKFYQLMRRMEECGLVFARSKVIDVAGGKIQRTFYKLTAEGVTSWKLSANFYAARAKMVAVLQRND